ncbi:radical SAM protein, TIGR01212 family [Prevotella sp. oral taxon 472 str. F0295]|nr:TIGR01212 family radical SAM protein [Prevotella sp. oral taxon 472]EEX52415.1 radical SAM protein, TIGR01212 family [Prevotella sp. oral taxon 472 str. F0295]
MQLPYNDFGNWMRSQFPFKVQKLSVNAGFTCPTRDGHTGFGGCTYCNNRSFNPSYCEPQQAVSQQLEAGKKFFARKYPNMKYLAYFQAYTSTYDTIDRLKAMYEEALMVEDVVGLVIGTRPDCMPDALLHYLEELNKHTFLIVEYGVESANNQTLERIKRGHTFECSRETIERTHQCGIRTGAHVIIGLPGEDAEESIRQASIISSLPINILKIHQMQIIRGTLLAKEYTEQPFHLYTVDEYLNVICEYVKRLRKDLVLERFVSQSPEGLLIAPKWGLKNYEFTNLLVRKMIDENIKQGEA